MSSTKVDPKKVVFIAGKQAHTMSAVEIDKRLLAYRKHETKLQELFKKKLLRNGPMSPSSNVSNFIRTYGTKTPAQYEEPERRRLLDDVAGVAEDLLDFAGDIKDASGFVRKEGMSGTKDSPSYKAAEKLLRVLEKDTLKLVETVREIKKIPKDTGGREIVVKAAEASAMAITAALVAQGLVLRIRKYLDKKK